MTIDSDVLKIARAQIGEKEDPLGSNKNKYGKWYGVDGVQWCAIFVSYCFYKAGLPLPATTPKGFAYCPSGVDWFRSKGRFFSEPKIGDVVFFDWYKGIRACTINDGDNVRCSDAWHIGIVEKVNSDGSITSIEGNTSETSNGNGGGVMRQTRDRDLWYGFGRPNYSTVSRVSNYPQFQGRIILLTSPNMKGEDIKTWKKRMIERGWNLGSGANDVFDSKADEVLRKFQAEKGLGVDGQLGELSWNAAWEEVVT